MNFIENKYLSIFLNFAIKFQINKKLIKSHFIFVKGNLESSFLI